MPGESASTHDEYKCRYIRSNNDTGTRHWQRSHSLDLVRNLTQPLIQLTCQRASIARVPRACVRSFPGRHSEILPRYQVVESIEAAGDGRLEQWSRWLQLVSQQSGEERDGVIAESGLTPRHAERTSSWIGMPREGLQSLVLRLNNGFI